MFTKKPPAENKSMAITRNSSAQSFSVLGTDLVVTGNLTASSDLHIDGTIDGDITCEALVQGESSKIAGIVTAKSARISGQIDGSVACGDLVILKSARITGDVHYDTLTIEQGAIVDGRLSPNSSAQNKAEDAPVGEVLILSSAAE